MHRRFIEHRLVAALADTRVVLLHGARQTGKSTLAQRLAGARGGRYLTLDDPAVLGLARADPAALVRGFEGLTVLDEAQLAPALFPALKLEVDRDRRPGRFLLTGSASVFLLPQIAESLAGRIEILPLCPLAPWTGCFPIRHGARGTARSTGSASAGASSPAASPRFSNAWHRNGATPGSAATWRHSRNATCATSGESRA